MESRNATLEAGIPAKAAGWELHDIAFDAIDRSAIADDTFAFRMVFLASLIETGSDVYAGNLVEYFAGDDEVSRWLAHSWEREELRHGKALRAYVEHVWPEVDWQRAYDAFFAEYSRTCTVDLLEPARGLELAARCMVETGTATLYGALHHFSREPVLKDLAARIFADEVRHYKIFYRHFRRYQERERHSRWRIGRTLFKRLRETRTGDGYYAFRELGEMSAGGVTRDWEREYREFARTFGNFVRTHAPREMSIRMGLKPLGLWPSVEDWITGHSAPVYAWWTR